MANINSATYRHLLLCIDRKVLQISVIFNPNSAIELCNEALKCNKTDTY